MSATFLSLIEKMREVASSSSDKGTRFEQLIRQFLLAEPEWSQQFKEVVLWKNYEHRNNRPDTGIDLVATTHDDQYVAVQCKFYENKISKGDIDSFLASSTKKEFVRRILVATSELSTNAAEAIHNQTPPVHVIGLSDLENSKVDWSTFDSDHPSKKLKLKPKKELRPHQTEAVKAVIDAFQTADRGKMIMACGTGKTFTSLKIAEKQAGKGGTVLFLVPSLSLMSQTLREWLAESSIPLQCYAVCSDVKVGKHDDADPTTPDDLVIPATTDGKTLAKSFSGGIHSPSLSGGTSSPAKNMTVVFSTYQSIDAIHEAQKKGVPEFDIIICDEAHRTTGAQLEGKEESDFVKIHNAKIIKGKKRLYMTATPRLYSSDAKTKAKEREVPLWSMDDKEHFGEVLYYLGFSSAVNQGLLSDYKVVILGVDARVAPFIEGGTTEKNKKELPLIDPAKIVGCWNALAGKYGNERKAKLHRAVAFTTSIKQSQTFRDQFNSIIAEYRENIGDTDKKALHCIVDHVDGSMDAVNRNNRLQWLKEEPKKNECRILSNARCLSEGVDVPALDAVLFLTPRKSKVDVVQSVGRVMRKAPGKDFGYIIIPVVVKPGIKPEDALDDNEAYDMVWGVLQALRAHDDRFQNQINVCELDGKEPEKIEVCFIGSASVDGTPKEVKPDTQQFFHWTNEETVKWKNVLYATLVKKCGEKRYWEDWAKDVAELAQQHIETLTKLADDDAHKNDFAAFLAHLRINLNDSITEAEAIEMLAQHIITKPVFTALFNSDVFSKNNPVSLALDKVVGLLEDVQQSRNQLAAAPVRRTDSVNLDQFYDSVRDRVSGVTTAEGRQKIIIELYDKFFKTAFPKLSEKLGIVYTPVEVVDWIIKAVDQALRQEFGEGIGAKNVHVLDPFTGTGTFIVRLLQSGLIDKKDLKRKYESELHANELVLLAYYIAAINIENTYREVIATEPQSFSRRTCAAHKSQSTDCGSEAFPGIVHTDTFTMTQEKKLVDDVNSKRAKRQKETPITVIIGNPPYSVGQRSANDSNPNTAYQQLDDRIKATYAAASNAALQRNLYDSYIRAFRWATDRIGDKGIICFVTNGGWIDKNAMDGFRKCLADEFTDIYVLNLRGGIRGKQGDSAKKEGQNVFPIMTQIAVTLLIKNPEKVGCRPPGGNVGDSRLEVPVRSTARTRPAVECLPSADIHYHDIGDYLDRNEKLQILAGADGLQGIDWQTITPNEKRDWINQRGDVFASFIPLGDKKDKDTETIFDMFAIGIATNRDAWCYNFSKKKLTGNMTRMIEFYNEQVEEYKERKEWDKEITVEQFINNDPQKIAWTVNLKKDVERIKTHKFTDNESRIAAYRPFVKHWIYYDKPFIERPGLWSQIFPVSGVENLVICVTSIGSRKDFCAVISDAISDLELVEKAQCFPLYTYERVEVGCRPPGGNVRYSALEPQSAIADAPARRSGAYLLHSPDCGSAGVRVGDYIRRENISDTMLRKFQDRFSDRTCSVTKEDIFYYVYGILHSESYKTCFAPDLKKQLPRIPLVSGVNLFRQFSEAGRKLAALHLNYETGEMYPLEENVLAGGLVPPSYHVTKMRFSSKTDKSMIIYNNQLHLAGIPAEAYRYVVNGRSAIEWIMERYQVSTHKDSGIVNDPNDWCKEQGNDRYIVDLIKRVVHLSVESVKIIEGLPKVEF